MNKEIFAQNLNADTISTHLIFTNNEGFITKDEGLAFLLANSLIDTTKSSKEWNKIKLNDTIGRYFRIENSDNYMMCLPYSLDNFESKFLIILINSHGEIEKSEKYNLGNAARWNNYYTGFLKKGNFFELLAQGGYGCGQYHYCNLYLFKELLPQDSITKIRLSEQKIIYKNINFSIKKIIKSCRFSFEIKNDELIVHYMLINGKLKYDKDENLFFKFSPHAKKYTVKYIYKNGKWTANKKRYLKRIEKYMIVKKYQFYM